MHPYFETGTSPALFERQMQFLSENGYKTVSLEEVVEAVKTGQKAGKWVAITFDDAYRDFYTKAFPVLTRYNFKAIVFVVPGFTGGLQPGPNGEEYMSWREVMEISVQGVGIGSHTMTHPKLHFLRPSEIEEEIRRSKGLIQDRLGVPVQSFAYPFAFPEQDRHFVRMLRDLLHLHGYQTGVCTIIGRAHCGHDTLFLPRLPVNTYDDLQLFEAKLNGGYDWLHWVQYSAKLLGARLS